MSDTITEGLPAYVAALIGTPVISWGLDGEYVYAGHYEQGTRMTFDLRHRRTTLAAPYTKVAPATVVTPVKDERVVVTKGTKEQAKADVGYGPLGIWRLAPQGPDGRPSWHKTKRDATTTGLTRQAILDWQEASA